MKSILIFLSILISLNFVLASDCPSGVYPCNPNVQFNNPQTSSVTFNNNTGNVNNSQYLQGLTPQQVADLKEQNYTNIALTNKSNTFNGNQTIIGNFGINVSPLYKFDINQGSVNVNPAQLHLSTDGTDTGMWVFTTGQSAWFSGGAVWQNSAWKAKAENAHIIGGVNGGFNIFVDTGLTINNTFTPTPRLMVYPSGIIVPPGGYTQIQAWGAYPTIGTAAKSVLGAGGAAGIVGTMTNHPLYFYVNSVYKWSMGTDGSFKSGTDGKSLYNIVTAGNGSFGNVIVGTSDHAELGLYGIGAYGYGNLSGVWGISPTVGVYGSDYLGTGLAGYFQGDVVINGSLTYSSSDPLVESFYPTNRTQAKQLIEDETPPSKFGGVSIYFNEETQDLELIDQKTRKVYKFVLEEVGTIDKLSPKRNEINITVLTTR